MDEYVILVDENDRKIGLEEKIKAHTGAGMLHRAFSIYIFNAKGELMLQHRAYTKYHGGGLWTNTVCGHPRDNEKVGDAAHRRLREEMGFDCGLDERFSFIYHVEIGKGFSEYEYLHVFIGEYDRDPKVNPAEAKGFKWVSLQELNNDIARYPKLYSPWMRLTLDRIIEERNK